MDEVDTLFKAVAFHIDGGHFQSVQADVHRIHLGIGIMVGNLHGQAAAACAQVQRAVHQFGIFNPRRERFAQEFVNKRTRHDDAVVHIKIVISLPRLIREIGNGHAFGYAAFQQREQFCALVRQQHRIQIGFKRVQRQVERVQDKIGGFVVCIVAAVAEEESGGVEV